MPILRNLKALEILDSRGRPTLEVRVTLDRGISARAQVPAGASTGAAEAVELRDRDPHRHAGLGCLSAVALVAGEVSRAMVGREFSEQKDLDHALLDLDGTPNKSRLGANVILGISLAFARACSLERAIPLYRHFACLVGRDIRSLSLPRPMINLFSGGKHAGGQVDVQDVLVVPGSSRSMRDALAVACGVYRSAADLGQSRFGARPLVGDEGGLAPNFPDSEAMLREAVDAITIAGFAPAAEVALAVDVAASHFAVGGHYRLDETELDGEAMVRRMVQWARQYGLVSLEDPLGEEDWCHWRRLRAELPPQCQLLGDDLLCTCAHRIRRAIEERAANALLLKVNQIGTLTQAAEALRAARDAGWKVTISARSGETEDDWLADLAVGWSGDYIKIGSVTRSERLAKYNRLLAIEEETGIGFAPPLPG